MSLAGYCVYLTLLIPTYLRTTIAWRGDGLFTISSEQLVLAVFWGEGHIEFGVLLRCIKKPPLASRHEMMLSWSLRSALESCYSKVDVNFCNPASRHLPFSADFPAPPNSKNMSAVFTCCRHRVWPPHL